MSTKKHSSVETCAICLDVMDKNLFLCSCCKNKLHIECVRKMIKFNKRNRNYSLCPLCRNYINERTPLIVKNDDACCTHLVCKLFLCCAICVYR